MVEVIIVVVVDSILDVRGKIFDVGVDFFD